MIGQFHTLFYGSVRMFFLGVLGSAVYGNEALHFSCDPDRRDLNLYCYNQFRPITPQVIASVRNCQVRHINHMPAGRGRVGNANSTGPKQTGEVCQAHFWGGSVTLRIDLLKILPTQGAANLPNFTIKLHTWVLL